MIRTFRRDTRDVVSSHFQAHSSSPPQPSRLRACERHATLYFSTSANSYAVSKEKAIPGSVELWLDVQFKSSPSRSHPLVPDQRPPDWRQIKQHYGARRHSAVRERLSSRLTLDTGRRVSAH